ncbi:MAG: hypothetical protein P1V81_04120 [Planctomycetota bacterium]|nr:hypothetical protein [Planctomycetota bacterium]
MKQLVVALAIAVLAVALWFVLDEGPGTTDPGGAGGPSPTPAQPGQPDRPRTGPDALAEDDLAEDRARTAVLAPQAPPAIVFLESDPDGLLFDVKLEADGRPLPNAHLIYLGSEVAMSEGAEELLAAGLGIDAVLNTFGRHYRCDESGEVRIGDLEVDAIVRARGELDGVRYAGLLEVDKAGTTVLVTPELGFEVRVEDQAGQPIAGAPVELVAETTWGDDAQRFPIQAATTDGDGTLFLPNILLSMSEQSAQLVNEEEGGRALVALSGFFAETPETEVDWRANTPEQLTLVRPPVGRVEVTVKDSTGIDMTAGYVTLGPSGFDYALGESAPSSSLYRSTSMAEENTVAFGVVQRGVPFDLRFGTSTSPGLAEAKDLVLAEDQELLRVELVVESLVPTLTARALLDDGTLLADAILTFGKEVQWSSAPERLDTVTTDEEGHLEKLAPWYEEDGLLLLYEHPTRGRLSAPLDGLGQPEDGLLELGDVILGPEPVLAAGRVVNSAGEGMAVLVSLEPSARGTHQLPPEAVQAERWRRWQVMSGADGRFELRGTSRSTHFEIEARSQAFIAPEPREVFAGETGIELELLSSCYFTFKLPPEVEGLEDAVQLIIDNGEGRGGKSYNPVAGGSSPALPPGDYTYTFVLGSEDESLLLTGTVHLEPGKDVDLGLLVFQHQVRHYKIFLALPEGVPPDAVWVSAFHQVTSPSGAISDEAFGYTKHEGGGVWNLYTAEAASVLKAYFSGYNQEYALVEGDNHLSFDMP